MLRVGKGLVVVGEKYWLVNWLQFAFCLVVLLQWVESCWRCWSWLRFVNQFGGLPDFLEWGIDNSLLVVEKDWLGSWLHFAFHLLVVLYLVESCGRCWLSWLQFVGQFG